MDVKSALIGQYQAGLEMLRNCVRVCPDDLWASGDQPRTFWRIAYHTIFYTHFYLMPNHEMLNLWEKHCWHGITLWTDERSDVPPHETTFTQAEVLEYLEVVYRAVPDWVNVLDLNSMDSGFPWYPGVPKLAHQLMNIRHLGVHVGQLQELLYARGIETPWVTVPQSGD